MSLRSDLMSLKTGGPVTLVVVVLLCACTVALTPRAINNVAESKQLRKTNFLIFLFLHDFKIPELPPKAQRRRQHYPTDCTLQAQPQVRISLPGDPLAVMLDALAAWRGEKILKGRRREKK